MRGGVNRGVLWLAVAWLLPATAASDDASILITINPEARVSVKWTGASPAPVLCGTAADLRVRVINQGFVTGTLEAELAGSVPEGVALEFHPEPLHGVAEEYRMLRVTLAKPGLADISVAFRMHHLSADIGGRDRVHFLLRCRPSVS
jgi:hypothetical protein